MAQNAKNSQADQAKGLLAQYFGYDQFRHQQAEIIDAIVQGEDALVLMPTGGGKSLCYQIPAMIRSGVGIVISPLIALMQDQVDSLREQGIRGAFINSSQDFQTRREVEQALLEDQLDLLYIAPERLLKPDTLALLRQARVALFAIDEAHCVSQWGHDFRPEYQQLKILPERFSGVPRIALTATAEPRTRQEIVDQLSLHEARHFIHSFDRPNIRYTLAEGGQSKQRLWKFLESQHVDDAGIVYCLSRKKVDDIANWLGEMGRTALPYHAGLSNDIRTRNQSRFLKEEGIIIVATIAFGMGIDKPDVRFVAHLNLPKSIEAYYQETGRAGRDGEAANAWMAYQLNDVITLSQMLQSSEGSEQYKRITQQKLDAMLALCEMTSCRRQALLAYFGEDLDEPCGNCDNCLSPPITWDGTEAAQKALSCVFRTGQRFGVSYLIDVLTGSDNPRIQNNRHHQLSTYGIGNELNKTGWRSLFRQLIARAYLSVDIDGFGGIRLAEKCRPILKGDQSIYFRRSAKKKAKQKSPGKTTEHSLGTYDTPLFEALKALRKEIAQEQNIPPYIVFHDRSLVAMASKRPVDRETMEQVPGVGQAKLDRYADSFLAVIENFPLPERLRNKLTRTVNETLALHLEGMNVAEIARQRSLDSETIHSHLADAIESGLLSVEEALELDEQEYEIICATLEEQQFLEHNRLRPVYEALGGAYDYGVLRCVAAELTLAN